MEHSSLGLIEVHGFLGIIAAADTALKAADVTLLAVEKISGGLSTLQITGDVGAVNAAIGAAIEITETLSCYHGSKVIPRVDPAVLEIIMPQTKKKAAVKPRNSGMKSTTGSGKKPSETAVENLTTNK